MTRMKKCAVVLAAGITLGLLSAKIAVSADGPADRSAKGGDLWDAGGPPSGGRLGELAFRDGEDSGPPGPPRDGEDRRPPPRRREQGPEADRHQPAGRMPPDQPGGGRPGGPGMPDMAHDGMAPFAPNWERMQNNDPEMYKLVKEDMDLERQSRELAQQYRRAPSEQREKLKQQIEEVVNKHFDARQQRRSLELKRLENQLQRLREAVERRAKARKELVEKRVSDLIGREDEAGF